MMNLSAPDKPKKKNFWSHLILFWLRAAFFIFFLIFIFFFVYILWKGASTISWDFLTQNPSQGMLAGGILPMILGTLLVSLICMMISFPLALLTAIYFSEYAKMNRWNHLLWRLIENLAGVPSIVYGLFGVGLFISLLGMRKSIFVAGATLALLALPVLVIQIYQTLQGVSKNFRMISASLGGYTWQGIMKIVLPQSWGGILTAFVVALGRVAGETAPIMLTGAAYYLSRPEYYLDSPFMAIPFHIFALLTQTNNVQMSAPIAYATALILILMIVILNILLTLIKRYLKYVGGK